MNGGLAMGLNQVQKNFRKEMKQLKNEGNDFENDIYSTTRKRTQIKRGLGISSVVLILILLYPLYGVYKSYQQNTTVFQHSKLVTYIEQMKQYDEQFSLALNTVLPNTPITDFTSYHYNVVEIETKLNEEMYELSKVKPPKGLDEYDRLFKERGQQILVLVYLLKLDSQLGNLNTNQINAILNEINEMSINERIALAHAFNELGINHNIDSEYNIRFEYMTY